MRTINPTVSPLYQFQFLFTVKNVTVTKMEAVVFAHNELEATVLFKARCPDVWAMLEVKNVGIGKQWMISGKAFNAKRPHVQSVHVWMAPVESVTPFTDFLKLYAHTVQGLSMVGLRTQLQNHKSHHIPTVEQIEILADETGVWPAEIQFYATKQFRAYCFNRAIEQYGKSVSRLLSTGEYEDCVYGRCEESVWQMLCGKLPNFAVVRYYTLSVGELLYFLDFNSGRKSDPAIYSGDVSVLDMPKRIGKHLCNIDSRFAVLLAQEEKERSN